MSKTVMGGSFFKAGSVQECMKTLSQKIGNRFKKFSLAFRFFDQHSTGKLTLADFTYGLDQLMVKFTRQQIGELFKRLDVDGDGYLNYQDFCELCEERIRDIDPFDAILQSVREK
jgi:Ca2+-binding EF-hand superfamily protein